MLNPFDNPFQDPDEKPKKYLFGKNKKESGLPPIKLSKDAKKAMERVFFDYEGIKLNKESFKFIQSLEKQVLLGQQNRTEEERWDKKKVKDIIKKKLSEENAVSEKGEILYLNCAFLELSKLPALPDALQRLHCDHNNLSELPALPDALQWLHCYNNNLSELPVLPDALQRLDCEYNNLSELPVLPKSLQELDCSSNPLTKQVIEKMKKHKNAEKFIYPKIGN